MSVPKAIEIISLILMLTWQSSAALAQAKVDFSESAGQSRLSVKDANVIPTISRDQSQDTQFLALLRARDGQFALIGELKRIVTYHDNLKVRFSRMIEDQVQIPDLKEINIQINKTISDLKIFEDEINSTQSVEAARELAKKFDSGFPLSPLDLPTARSNSQDARRNVQFRSSRPFVESERINAAEIFQNISLENREWLAKYESIFATISENLSKLTASPKKLKVLNELPADFYELAGGSSIEELTIDQIKSGIASYRKALQSAVLDEGGGNAPSKDSVREKILSSIDSVGQDLTQKSKEKNAEFRELEKSIAGSAKTLYGNKVGGDSFNYLLIVFMCVFGLIMLIPRIYKGDVAVNLLKAEFLLQFSTVFVLIAAIIILGIGELIDRQQLPVLLAGISGYVLGQLGKV